MQNQMLKNASLARYSDFFFMLFSILCKMSCYSCCTTFVIYAQKYCKTNNGLSFYIPNMATELYHMTAVKNSLTSVRKTDMFVF